MRHVVFLTQHRCFLVIVWAMLITSCQWSNYCAVSDRVYRVCVSTILIIYKDTMSLMQNLSVTEQPGDPVLICEHLRIPAEVWRSVLNIRVFELHSSRWENCWLHLDYNVLLYIISTKNVIYIHLSYSDRRNMNNISKRQLLLLYRDGSRIMDGKGSLQLGRSTLHYFKTGPFLRVYSSGPFNVSFLNFRNNARKSYFSTSSTLWRVFTLLYPNKLFCDRVTSIYKCCFAALILTSLRSNRHLCCLHFLSGSAVFSPSSQRFWSDIPSLVFLMINTWQL